MAIPLDFVGSLPAPSAGVSLGDLVAEHVTDSGRVQTFLDCIPTTSKPALHSPSITREPLTHDTIHGFITSFSLPCSERTRRLGPNDRIIVALPTTPESALALLALASYHTTAPVNATCTAAELLEDAERLGAKAVLSTSDSEDRLELRNLQAKLGCEIIYLHGRSSGPTGLFDLTLMDVPESSMASHFTAPSQLHGLEDQSLVLHTSGTSGKKKVVPYTLRSLLIGTCAVVISWDLKENDVNSKSLSRWEMSDILNNFRSVNMMPLFHVGGIVRNLFAPILSGGSAIMCAGFDAEDFWSLSVQLGSTWYVYHAFLTYFSSAHSN